jgi:hypothetical protein
MNLKRFWYVLTHWEQWHYNIKYALLSPVWLWYSLRARSFYFFTPANPTLTFGGFEGGPKREIYELLPNERIPRSIYIDPAWPLEKVESEMKTAGLSYPIAVKPNVGMMGLMFRKLDTREELSVYHKTMTAAYILQELVSYPIEVSVFYYRMPGQQKGTITGFVRKEALEVTGDGVSTLETLMQQLVNRPGFKLEEWKAKHKSRLNDVIPAGELFKLSWVANLSRGARLVSLENEKDDALLQVFDEISHAAKQLYYGRYDIKCSSVEDLKKGRNFTILEFNGTGAEPHHMYGNGNNLFQAFRIISHHWQALYSIARYHYKHGVKYKTLKEGIQFTRRSNKHFNHLRELDKQMPVYH